MASKSSKAAVSDARQLADLVSVGKATVGDLKLLGIHSIAALRKRDPQEMYDSLCRIIGKRHDPCCLDVFRAAVEQAKNPHLPREKCNWWYWSKVRKQQVRA